MAKRYSMSGHNVAEARLRQPSLNVRWSAVVVEDTQQITHTPPVTRAGNKLPTAQPTERHRNGEQGKTKQKKQPKERSRQKQSKVQPHKTKAKPVPARKKNTSQIGPQLYDLDKQLQPRQADTHKGRPSRQFKSKSKRTSRSKQEEQQRAHTFSLPWF